MASIHKRPDGVYGARSRDAAGKDSRHFDRKIDARQWLDWVTASGVRGYYGDPQTARLTVGQCVRRGSWATPRVEHQLCTRPGFTCG